MKNNLNKVWILTGILLLALALRVCPLSDLTRGSLDYSEGSMITDAAWPLSQIAREIPPDQAPLKYYLLHIALAFGRSEFLIGLPALFFDLASIFLLFFLGSLLFDRKAALLACFFMAISVWNIHHATLVRNYPLYSFSALASTFFLYRATLSQRFRDWLFFGMAAAFGFYSFYPFLFILAAQLCWFFVCYGRRIDLVKRLSLALVLFFAMVTPMLFRLADAFKYRADFGNGFWGLHGYQEIGRALLDHFGGVAGTFPWGILVFALSFFCVVYTQKKRRQALLLSLLVFVPICFYVACFFLLSICIVPRLFFHVYPFFLLMAAAGIMSWRHWVARLAGIFVFILPLCLYGLHCGGIRIGDFIPSDYRRHQENFSLVASAIEKHYNSTPLDYVAVVPWPSLFFIQYYLDKANKSPVVEFLKNSDKSRYSVYTHPRITLYGVDGDLPLLKELAAAGRLLVVDVVSGNLSTLPNGPETVFWLKSSASSIEHDQGADFYFISPPASVSGSYKDSSEAAQRRLFLDSYVAKRSNFTGKKAAQDGAA